MITEGDIRDTLNSYTAEYTLQEAYEDLQGVMHEVYRHLTKAAAALNAGMMETPGPINASPFADLATAQAHIRFALSACEPDEHPYGPVSNHPADVEYAIFGDLRTARQWDDDIPF